MALGKMTVKVVPDLSDVEALIRAEMARALASAGATLGEVSIEALHRTLHVYWHNNGGDLHDVAAALSQRFLILERDARKS